MPGSFDLMLSRNVQNWDVASGIVDEEAAKPTAGSHRDGMIKTEDIQLWEEEEKRAESSLDLQKGL